MMLDLPTPNDFPAFPYNPPYGIQIELMRHLYSSIEQRKVTIVESPTGTGKTLSLLCACLTWLNDERDRARKGKLRAASEDDVKAKDWVIEQTRERIRRELEAEEEEREERLARARKREMQMKAMAKARVWKKQKREGKSEDNRREEISEDEDRQFLPEEENATEYEDMNVSSALRALMAKVDKDSKWGFGEPAEGEPTCTKIYYASRTHSQLSQVLPELRRLKLAPRLRTHHDFDPHHPSVSSHRGSKRSSDALEAGNNEAEHVEACSTRTVSLGSRKQLCINDELRARHKDLDESCRELLGQKVSKRCEFLPPVDEESRMVDFRDQILASPKDIEDLASTGRMAHTCPYFGSRRAIPQAELVTLPYNLLLQKSAREALGIDLTDQIVIIDEAHNLISTLLALSTNRLPYSVLVTSFQQVCVYVTKFRNRLGATNLLHLKRLVVFLDALKKYVVQWKEEKTDKANKPCNADSTTKAEVITVAQLMEKLGRKAASINLLEIESYLKRSKVARKIASYSDKDAQRNGSRSPSGPGAVPPLHAVEAFMLSLTSANEDGRITFSLTGNPSHEEVELKYQQLNPSPHFKEIVDVARSVVLAGGTMSPIADVISQLFSYLPAERISSFSCGHIIPESNLQALVVTKGPCGGELEYKASKQDDPTVITELGNVLLNFSGMMPGGFVVFFPSYKFLHAAKAAWKRSGLLEKIDRKKKTFFEPEDATDVDDVLNEYAASIRRPLPSDNRKGGALLFAVVGAKLSEGLNFADDLARAVAIIGLPFANLGSPELQERLKYVKHLQEKADGNVKKQPGKKDAAAELYENMCMNAVNQSIGRAIRHRNDWASLILLDRRYASASIQNKLPSWIGQSIAVAETFGQAVKALGLFYRNKI